jgi:hypothetical protein
MKAKQRREITLETHEVTIIRIKNKKLNTFCSDCGAYTFHLTVPETISLLSLSETEVKRWLENKTIHAKEAEGVLLLCGTSLATLTKK